MIHEWIACILLLLGSVFMLISAVGVVRLPNLYIRMHASSKGASLGTLLTVGAVAVYFLEIKSFIEAMLVIIFTFLTSPVAAHMIGRAGYFLKVPMWKGTIIDELQNRYNHQDHTLRSQPPEE